jgi:hypothetical protein
MDITWENIFKLTTAFFASVGGATVVIIGVSKWFGDFLSQKLLASTSQKHEKDLEEIKSKYSKELEITKDDLAKARTMYARYSERQFNSYNSLWKVLLQTKRQAEVLWSEPNPDRLKTFAEQIRLTKQAIEDEQLLIEDKHIEQLNKLLHEFENFELGKTNLITILSRGNEAELPTQSEIETAIVNNKDVKDKYDQLLEKVVKNFRKQIKG